MLSKLKTGDLKEEHQELFDAFFHYTKDNNRNAAAYFYIDILRWNDIYLANSSN